MQGEERGANVWSTGRFSRDRPRFADTLDVIKFLCKDLWTLVFRKQIDNLKTNHRVHLPFPLSPPIYGIDTDRQGLIPRFAGCLRTHGQQLQAVLADEYGILVGGGGEGTAVPLVSVRSNQGGAC